MRKLIATAAVLSVLALAAGSSSAAAEKEKGKGEKGHKFDPEAVFKQMDRNNNGKVTKEEFLQFAHSRAAEWAGKLFDHADANHDGSLTLEEAKHQAERFHERFPKGKGADEPKHDPDAIFKQMDQNNNGKVTKEEFVSFMKSHAEEWAGKAFDRADTNHDGTLTREEFMTGAEHMRERWQLHHDKSKEREKTSEKK